MGLVSVIRKVALMAAGLWLAATAAARAEDGPYPVWWSPKLELESLEKIDERLARPIFPDWDGLRVYKGGEAATVTAPDLVRTCQEVLAAFRAGMSGWTGNEHALLWYHYSWCRAIEVLKTARPATVSFTRNFTLDRRAPRFLPLLVSGISGCNGLCIALSQNGKGIPWLTDEDAFAFKQISAEEASYDGGGGSEHMYILARADLDGDGREDLILLNGYGATQGTYSATDAFVLSRDAPNGVFYVLDAMRVMKEACPGYDCRSE